MKRYNAICGRNDELLKRIDIKAKNHISDDIRILENNYFKR